MPEPTNNTPPVTSIPGSTTAPVPAGASPANPHTHIKVIDEAHELFGKVCKIVSMTVHEVIVEFETAGSWIKSRLTPAQVAVVPAPIESSAASETGALTETEKTATTEPETEESGAPETVGSAPVVTS